MRIAGDTDDEELECPRCHAAMARREVEVLGPNVHVDVCPACRGMWFDGGELRRVLRDRRVGDRLEPMPEGGRRGAIACPRCGGPMDLRRAADLEVDLCPDCRGVWLDMGELGALEVISRQGPPRHQEGKPGALRDERSRRRREMSFYRFLRDFSRG